MRIKKVKDKSKSRSSNKTSSYIEDLTKEDETDENDESVLFSLSVISDMTVPLVSSAEMFISSLL